MRAHFIAVRTDLEHQLPFRQLVHQFYRPDQEDDAIDLMVLGAVIRFWQWVSITFENSQHAIDHPRAVIDKVVRLEGFATAMERVGWLEVGDGFVSIPHFDSWLSRSAKKRHCSTQRKSNYRAAQGADKSGTYNNNNNNNKGGSSHILNPGNSVQGGPEYLSAIQTALRAKGVSDDNATTCSLRLSGMGIPVLTVLNRLNECPQNIRSLTGWLIRSFETQQR